MLLSGADGRDNHMVLVLKQEINVSMLYPMNWKLLNLCMKLQPNVSGVTKYKNNGCNSGKEFSKITVVLIDCLKDSNLPVNACWITSL